MSARLFEFSCVDGLNSKSVSSRSRREEDQSTKDDYIQDPHDEREWVLRFIMQSECGGDAAIPATCRNGWFGVPHDVILVAVLVVVFPQET